MIWEKPLYKSRPLSEWIQDVTLPDGIEKLVETTKTTETARKNLIKGALFLVSDTRKDEAIASILAALKNHADEVICLTSFQVLRGLARLPKRNEPDSFVINLETTDLLIVTGMNGMAKEEITTLDRALESRGFRPPKVTVLIGEEPAEQKSHFEALRGAYAGRVYELRSKAATKSA